MWNPFANLRQKVSIGKVIFQTVQAWAKKNGIAYAREGYMQNPTVYACIDLTSKSASKIPLYVEVNEKRAKKHPLQDLLDRPNQTQGGIEFRKAAFSWELMGGNAYTEKIRTVGNMPTHLWNWQPYSFSIKREKGQPIPSFYCFDYNGADQRLWPVDNLTGASDLMHWRTFNPDPEDPDFGMAPLMAAASSTDQSNMARLWNKSTLENSASFSMVVSAEDAVDPKERKQIEKDINEKYTGAGNNNKWAFFGGGAKVNKMSMSPSEMDWLNGLKLNSQEIASVYNVPTQMLGIEGSQTFANFAEARVFFYLQAVLPLLDGYLDELNRWLAPDFGDNVKIVYDKNDIDALEPLRAEARAEKLNSPDLTRNEKREILGKEPYNPSGIDNEADMLFISTNEVPLGEDFFSEADDSEVADESGEE